MRKTFFPKLALNNIKKNRKTYIPYILTCILTVTMFYIVCSLSLNPGMEKMTGGDTIASLLTFGCWVIALFVSIFLFYTNSFLVKRRKKEFGIFNVLGMEKRHLSIVLLWETIYVMLISLSAGFLLGIALDKAMFLLIGKVLGAETVFGFFISIEALKLTGMLFAAIFVLILCNSIAQIHLAQPMELLRGGSAGEKEPKTKWLLAVLGILCVGSGYFLAINVEDPLESVIIFFVAVVLVIVGTYMLFTAGSIAFLKLMRKNKSYYYKTKHFISISGMIYRMKQNAVGLANICILSTMVLVMVSSTSSLMIGIEDILNTRYPSNIVVYSYQTNEERSEEMFRTVHRLQDEFHITVKNEIAYVYFDFTAYRNGDTFSMKPDASVSVFSSSNVLFFITLSDYNAAEGENKKLRDGEILIYSNRKPYGEPVLKLLGKEYQIAEELDHFTGNGIVAALMANAQYIIVPDRKELDEICNKYKEARGGTGSDIAQFYGFDMEEDDDIQKDFYEAVRKSFKELQSGDFNIESKASARADFMGLYGGLFFIGVFLAVLFVMATVLIIYYKQISEGYDDRERFVIMQKVGMSRSEVKASIHSQVLTVFFLPLIVAGIHVAAAFPLISKLLALLNCINTHLYIMSTMVSFLVFSVLYAVIYVLTAKNYYHIVSR